MNFDWGDIAVACAAVTWAALIGAAILYSRSGDASAEADEAPAHVDKAASGQSDDGGRHDLAQPQSPPETSDDVVDAIVRRVPIPQRGTSSPPPARRAPLPRTWPEPASAPQAPAAAPASTVPTLSAGATVNFEQALAGLAQIANRAERKSADVAALPTLPPALTPPTAQQARHARLPPDYDAHHEPGYLYLARNEAYKPGLYKMGLTRRADGRAQTLNESRQAALDVGEVAILHCVEVPDMGTAEKTLFDACAERRVAGGVEYFFGREAVFRRALDAVAADAAGHPNALETFRASRPFAADQQIPTMRDELVPMRPRLDDEPSVYLLRNFWHADGVYRFALTAKTGADLMKRWNALQRRGNGVFGFYQAVAVFPVSDLREAKAALRLAAKPFAFGGRPSFVRGDLADIEAMMRRALGGPAAPQPRAPGMRAEAVVRPRREEAPWNPPCPHCGQLLQFRAGAIGESAEVPCPSCGGLILAHIGGAKSTASPLP